MSRHLLLALLLAAVGCKPDSQSPLDTRMLKVAAGRYAVGGDKHTIEKDFWIDPYEVTNAEYAAFLASQEGAELQPPTHWQGREAPTGLEQHPVHNVSLSDAEAYAAWRKKRLPTEAEWEAAGRGPEGFWYPWGNNPDKASENALLGHWASYDVATQPVGKYPAGKSWCGAYDMLGNVAEWTSTRLGSNQVVKGGSFATPIEELGKVTLGSRVAVDPSKGYDAVGFRCAW